MPDKIARGYADDGRIFLIFVHDRKLYTISHPGVIKAAGFFHFSGFQSPAMTGTPIRPMASKANP